MKKGPTRKYYTPRLQSLEDDPEAQPVELLSLDPALHATPASPGSAAGVLSAHRSPELGPLLQEQEAIDDADSYAASASSRRVQPPEPEPAPSEHFFQVVDFLLALCGSLHKYGMPTHRLEYQITWAAEAFGIEAAVAVFPTYISAMFRQKDSHNSYTYNLQNEASWDLEKLELADSLAKRVATRKLTLTEGILALKEIQNKKPRYAWWFKLACMTLMSGVICPLYFRGGVVEAGISLICGFIAGLFTLLADHAVAFARLLEPLTAISCAVVASVLNAEGWLGPVSPGCIMLAGVVWALPGLQLNKSTSDLATHMMVSGTARLLFALLIIFEIAFGLALGSRVSELIATDTASSSSVASVPTITLSPWLDILWTPIAAMTFAVMLGAAPKQLPSIIVAGAFASLVSLLQSAFGSDLSTMLAQAAIVLTGNIYARVFDRPSFIPTCIGSLMLVPSSLGVRGVTTSIVSNNLVSAMQFTFAMLITSVSMVVGGFLANMILFPKKAF